MRKTILLLLAVLLAVFLPAAGSGEAQGTVQPDETVNQTRYSFEHRILPRMFYSAPEEMMDKLREGAVYELWAGISAENGFDVTYSAEEFVTEDVPADQGIAMVRVTMPKPDETPLCSRIYFCYDTEMKKAGYYTVEYDDYYGENYFLCAWNAEGKHQDFGPGRALDPESAEYETGLAEEAEEIRKLMRTDTAAEAGKE